MHIYIYMVLLVVNTNFLSIGFLCVALASPRYKTGLRIECCVISFWLLEVHVHMYHNWIQRPFQLNKNVDKDKNEDFHPFLHLLI